MIKENPFLKCQERSWISNDECDKKKEKQESIVSKIKNIFKK